MQPRCPIQKQLASERIKQVPSLSSTSGDIDLANNPRLVRARPFLDLLGVVLAFLEGDVAQIDELLQENNIICLYNRSLGIDCQV